VVSVSPKLGTSGGGSRTTVDATQGHRSLRKTDLDSHTQGCWRATRFEKSSVYGFVPRPMPPRRVRVRRSVRRTGRRSVRLQPERGAVVFGKRPPTQALEPPPLASRRDSVEMVRVWAAPNDGQQIVLRTMWSDPAAWGLLLVDIARHAAKAYEREGRDPAEVLARIREGFDAEWVVPTDRPEDLTGQE